MGKQPKTILFLCTANHYRSRFAEILFISVAGKKGWRGMRRRGDWLLSEAFTTSGRCQ